MLWILRWHYLFFTQVNFNRIWLLLYVSLCVVALSKCSKSNNGHCLKPEECSHKFPSSQESGALLEGVKGDIQSACMQNMANRFQRQSRRKSDSYNFEIQEHSESWEQKNEVTISKLVNFQSSNHIVNVLQNGNFMQNTELLSALPTLEKEPRILSRSYPLGRWHIFHYYFSHANLCRSRRVFQQRQSSHCK